MQIAAHKKNRELLSPKSGLTVEQIPTTGSKRAENIITWLNTFESYEELSLTVKSILANIRFGVNADNFEEALNSIGIAIGFSCERPDKEWKEGPDNLWSLRDGLFLHIEDKSEVDLMRTEIHKQETGQMNNSCAWFDKNYKGVNVKNLLIIPTRKLGSGAGFNKEVEIVRDKNLKKLTRNIDTAENRTQRHWLLILDNLLQSHQPYSRSIGQ